jgi:hypothetical protein
VSAAEEIRAQALEVAAGWSPDGAPESWRLTASLFGAIAAHEELLGRLASLPADRLPALLAAAAISYLVRRDRPAPLATYFPQPGGPQPGGTPCVSSPATCSARCPPCWTRSRPAAGSSSPTRTYDGSVESSRLLARAHPSGEWVEWLA